MDLSKITAPRDEVTIQGQTCTFSALTNGDNEELVQMLKAHRPQPQAAAAELIAAVPSLTADERREVLKMAFYAMMNPKLVTAVEFELFKEGPEGVIETWFRKLRRVHSAIDRDQVRILYEAAAAEEVAKVERLDEVPPLGNSSGPAAAGPPAP